MASSASRTTVVIATRDRADELAVTLQQLARIRPQPPIIVVDNGSTDATVQVARDAARSLPVRVVELQYNAGAVARNHGVELADTPYVAFCDDDSWWEADAFGCAEELFDRYPRLGLIAGRTLVGPEEVPDPMNEALANSPLGRDPDAPGPAVLGFLACAAIVRREAFIETGGFSAVLQFAGEETLVAYDLAAAGWTLSYVPEIVAHHHPSQQRMPSVARRNRQARNAALTTWMRRPIGRC
ncbi:MAG: glycosyltransferase family 2 protein, partial [Aldersonia sp.]|nr:glycosyltransferase family 2 protein [Aldersonia sp.]